ncbi:MAG: DNA/RNA nuclease SfsA [Magnetococcales bacterium]|nr:DNA/RNA nuclease SfsA [Magnetococcales bacterium]
MTFDEPLLSGTLIRRYKRFLADVRLDDGTEITVHCPNSGSMLGLNAPGNRVWISRSDNAKRKYPHTLELVEASQSIMIDPDGKRTAVESPATLVGVHTGRTNALVREALEAGNIPSLAGFSSLRPEVRFGEESRLDFQLKFSGIGVSKDCYIEVKSVTLRLGDTLAFPDAVTKRGQKHLHNLREAVCQGHRAVILFVLQREDGEGFRPAHEIDPEYARTLSDVIHAGVECLAMRCRVNTTGIAITAPATVTIDTL